MHNFPEIILILICGLCAGSFITMASYRFALEGQKISYLLLSRSFCSNCDAKLTVRNLIPLFSWIFQKGKCSFCHSKISIRYPAIEFSLMTIFLIIYFVNGQVINIQFCLILFMAILLMIMVVTDLENYFIPDSTQIILGITVIIYHLVSGDWNMPYYFVSAGLFIMFGLTLDYSFLIFANKKAIGVDDIKFFGVAGLLLGVGQFPLFMVFSGFAGLIFGGIWQKITKDNVFPFAPALVISFMVCLLLKGRVDYEDLILSIFWR